ncbi:MAG: CPBP family intramembrane metalloprotease [Cyclobacteriaceae bacterium]|nr:CPBP family intramembrane metalloprotease [Cyclobacteriaceae bacterium]
MLSYREHQQEYGQNYAYLILSTLATTLGTVGALAYSYRKQRKLPLFLLQYMKSLDLQQFLNGVVLSTAQILFCVLVLIFGLVSFQFDSIKNIPWAIILFALVSVSEEVMFRGYLLPKLLEKFSLWPSIIISSLLFACSHLANPHIDVIGFTNIFLFGVWAAILYVHHQNLSSALGAHFSWNLLQTFFGFGVSGHAFNGVFRVTQLSSATYLTGGVFGLEGSVLALVALLVLIFYFSKKLKPHALGLR